MIGSRLRPRLIALTLLAPLLVLGALGCRGARVKVDAAYLSENSVYRSAAFAREPYLFEVGDRSVEIICRTFSASPPRLQVAPFSESLRERWSSAEVTIREAERRQLAAAGHEAGMPVFQHRVSLQGLEPRTRYRCRLLARDASEWREVQPRTLPDAQRPLEPDDRLSFLVLGDSGTGSQAQLAVARAIARSLDEPSGEAHDVDFWVHTGDLVYIHGQREGYDPFVFAPYRRLLSRAPMYGVVGNHDVRTDDGRPFFEVFPQGTFDRGWWRRVLGPVELLGCDSTRGAGRNLRDATSRQRRWLRATLPDSRAPWRILLTHHPVLSAGVRHGAGRRAGARETARMRSSLYDAFGRVDLILQGHDHHYERSIPIAPAWIDPEDGDLAIPDYEQGLRERAGGPVEPAQVTLDGRTVAILQGTGGGIVVDGAAIRTGWAVMWALTLPIGSPLWMSWLPVGFDWVDPGFPWVERAGHFYGFSRIDASPDALRVRTFAVDTDTAKARTVDDVTYVR